VGAVEVVVEVGAELECFADFEPEPQPVSATASEITAMEMLIATDGFFTRFSMRSAAACRG
jgi:hypothetical protein